MSEKLIDRAPTLGLYCEDPARLAGKLMVSSLYTVGPDKARHQGYRPFGAILPSTPRVPTASELHHFVNNGAERMLQALELPAQFGLRSMTAPTQEIRGPKMPLWNARTPIIPGIDGVFMERRIDPPGLLTTSTDQRFYSDRFRRLGLVGMHFDGWPSTEVTYLVANIGDPPYTSSSPQAGR